MTNEEILTAIQSDVNDLLTTKYKDIHIGWILIVGKDGINSYAGNACAICILQAMFNWILDNGIKHMYHNDEPILTNETKH